MFNLSFFLTEDHYDRTIDTYIKNIRQKIESDHKNPKYIHIVYRAGYKFEAL